MPINPTVITAQLKDDELRKSIDALVDYVGDKTQEMATKFEGAMDIMKSSMKDFAVTQKVSVDMMKESWRDMSKAFDAMYKAQSLKMDEGGGGVSENPDTVNGLKSLISYHEALIGNMELESDELGESVEQLAREKAYLKENLSTQEEITRQVEKQEALEKRRQKKQLQDAQAPFMSDYKMVLQQSDVYLNGAIKKMKELKDIQERMKQSGLFNETQLREVQKRIDVLGEKIKRLKANAPKTLKQVIGMDESSIEAISQKLSALRRVKVGNPEEIKQLSNEYQRLGELQAKMMGRSLQFANANNVLARSFNYIRNRIIYALSVTALTQFGRELYEVRAQYELLERSLGVLVNSFENGSRIFQELSGMALKSPFTLIELGTAAKQLTAYNFAAKEVIGTTKRLADISAALGVPMERLTYNLGQIRAQTVLTSRDARDFANAGLPMVKALADYYTELEGRVVSTGEVFDRMKDKAVSYNDVMAVLTKMTDEGGKFFDFQAKQADTLKVQLANLHLAWNNFLNDLGKSNQNAMTGPIKGIKALLQNWKEINKVITSLIVGYGAVKAKQIVFNTLLGKGTLEAIKQANAIKANTQQKYKNALATKGLSNEQAMLVLSLNRENVTLKKAMVSMKLLTAEQANAIVSCSKWRLSLTQLQIVGKMAFNGIATSLAKLGTLLKTNAWFIAFSALADLFLTMKNNAEAVKQLNEDLANSAKEASDSMEEYLRVARKNQTITKAMNGELSDDELSKTWDSLREKIEQTSSASDIFIKQLLEEDDLSKRVAKGFEIAQSIQDANNKLKDFNNELKITEDGAWGGLLGGEGLVADLNDAVKARKMYLDQLENSLHKNDVSSFEKNFANQLKEVKGEVGVTAKSIVDIIKKNGIKGESEIRETIERIKKNIIQSKNLGGDAAQLFSYELDRSLGDALNNFGVSSTTVWKTILDNIKNDSSSAFIGITNDILNEEAKWSDAQMEAIQNAVDKAKNQLPKDASDIFDEIQKDFYSRDWKIRITAQFDAQDVDAIQKAFDKSFPKMGVWAGLRPEAGKTFTEYGKDINKTIKETGESIKTLQKQLDEARKSEKAGSEELVKGLESELQKNKDINDAATKIKNTWHIQNEEKKTNGSKKDPLLDALKVEIDLVEKLQQEYKKLEKLGYKESEIVSTIQDTYGSTIKLLNSDLAKFGLPKLDMGIISSDNPNEALKYFKALKDLIESKGFANLDRMKALDGVIGKLTISARTYNMDKVTQGLNNELAKLKEDYELGITLEANPELGDIMSNFLGIDTNQLPSDFTSALRQIQGKVSSILKENGIEESFDIGEMLDKKKFDAWVEGNSRKMKSDFIEALNAIRKYLFDLQEKEAKNLSNEWSKLIDKYGQLESQLMKISKETSEELVNVVKKVGSNENVKKALDLAKRIKISTDPKEVQRLSKELMELVQKVSANNPTATSITTAITNKDAREKATKEWEDFKNTDLYTKVFEDMSTKSRFTLQLIIDKLEELKNKVKEDPVAMKEVMRNIQGAKDELIKRNPFGAMAEGLSEWSDAVRKARQEKQLLSEIEDKLQEAKKSGDKEEIANWQKKYDAQVQATAEAIDNETKAQNKFIKATQAGSNLMSQMANFTKQFTSLLGIAEDSEAGEVVNDIVGGFQMMATVLGLVAVAATIAGAAFWWVTVVAAALGALIGLFSFFAGAQNRRINKAIKESEANVRSLEYAYKDLEAAVKDAYGAEVYGLKQAEIANKKAQLAELERQYELEKSRKGKHYDQEKIDEYKGKVQDLRNEIKEMVKDTTNDLLGISSVGDAAEQLVSSMIEAFRQGEDYMGKFTESFDDMIDNMIMKAIVSKVIGERIQQIFDMVEAKGNERGADIKAQMEELTNRRVEYDKLAAKLQEYVSYWAGTWVENNDEYKEAVENLGKLYAYSESIEGKLEELAKEYEEATRQTPEDIQEFRDAISGMKDDVKSEFEAWMEAFGIKFGESAKSDLSNLQQGISGITEETAGALEGYMNGVSQQVYYQSELLTQIRDSIIGFQGDIQLATQAQMLLQLQQSYVVQMAIQNVLQGALNPSGRAFMVELNQ